jgi:hypothetical protein
VNATDTQDWVTQQLAAAPTPGAGDLDRAWALLLEQTSVKTDTSGDLHRAGSAAAVALQLARRRAS